MYKIIIEVAEIFLPIITQYAASLRFNYENIISASKDIFNNEVFDVIL